MSGIKGKILGDIVKDMFDSDRDGTTLTIEQIAKHSIGNGKVTIVALEWVHGMLRAAREYLESEHGETFIPVTQYFLDNYYGERPPRSEDEARKCVAGNGGKTRKTVGIRKIWIGYKNDAMAFIWLNHGFKSGGNKWRKVVNRLLAGYSAGAVTDAKAQQALELNYHRLMPNDRKTFIALLPFTTMQKLTLNGADKELESTRKTTKAHRNVN
jgi:hypothetical protein